MPLDVETILRTWDTLLAVRRPWEPDWQYICDLMLPGQNDVITRQAPGTQRTEDLLDSTAMLGLELLAGHIFGSVTNFSMQFFLLSLRRMTRSQAASRWLDEVAETQLNEMRADDSQLPSTVHEFLLMYAGLGTGCGFVDEKPMRERPRQGFRGFQARSLPIASYAIAEDASGKVDTVYRALELSPVQAAEMFGRESLHRSVQDMLGNVARAAEWYTPTPYLHAVYPRALSERREGQGSKSMAFASVYVDHKNHHICSESGYPSLPYVVARWSKLSSYSPWGYGRGHLALPEALTLNAIDVDALRQLALNVQPPVWVIGAGEETTGRVSLMPGAVNPLAAGSSVEWAAPGGNYDVTRLGVEERRQRIRQIFFTDQLQFLPDPTEQRQMTAFEVGQRVQLMQRLMGPAFMRLLSEFLNPLIDLTFSLLLDAGVLPFPPDEVVELAHQTGGVIDVEYQGALARAQSDSDVEAIDEALELAVRFDKETGGLRGSLLDNLDVDEAFRKRAMVRGLPKGLLIDPRKVKAMRDAQQQQMAQERQAAGLREDAAAAGRAAPALQAIREVAGNGS
jgi:Bacteriophage head to tail connecting protein